MLELVDIKKDYRVAGEPVHALKGVSIKFRRNEFVSILGASGCGKTTLLNIIGGLDKYTSGDLLIEGKSTKQYKDRDWDTYRNHSIGFIFQSYHLIPHQSVLQNVELALMISGVSREERRQRAIEALKKVGLEDKIHNKPNQLSGGQAQRVAIARALINDPEIVLADEPTGALDSKTSVQIMELLKEISRDRLVIMVTHNPELAVQYSTRIVRLLDGEVVDDSMPYDGRPYKYYRPQVNSENTPEYDATNDVAEGEKPVSEQIETSGEIKKTNKGKKKKTSMSFGMAFTLSLKNLLSKSKRTAMVSVAGSIGIIGVSMVLAISAGVTGYIQSMENDMLSGYPLAVTQTAIDFNALMDMASAAGVKVDTTRLDDKIYIDSLIERLMGLNGTTTTNNITAAYADYVQKMPDTYYNALQFNYGFQPAHNIYTNFKLDKDDEGEEVSVTGIRSMYTAVLNEISKEEGNEQYGQFAQIIPTVTTFLELPDNYNYILSQYDILASSNGKTVDLTEAELKDIFENKDSLIMVVNDNATTDLVLGQFGYFTQEEFITFAKKAKTDVDGGDSSKYDEILKEFLDGKDFDFFIDGEGESTFKWYPNDTIYSNENLTGLIVPGKEIGQYAQAKYKYLAYSADFADDRDTSNDIDLKVKVILQKKKGISYGCLSTGIYYTNALSEHTLETGRNSKLVKFIEENGILDALPFPYHYTYDGVRHDTNVNNPAFPLYDFFVNVGDMTSMMIGGMTGSGDSDQYASIRIGADHVGGGKIPKAFYIYPLNFESKDLATEYLDKWNDMCDNETEYEYSFNGLTGTLKLGEQYEVQYTDTVGLIITMVNTMITMITIALVAFTALSLVVSTVMIGIITYVSVVERIKEIGILRSVGARKKDIKALFNAETFIIGFTSGLVGILVTYLISLVLNLIIGTLFGVFTIAALPWWQALIMVGISVILTLISGLLPASAAAKKDPVVALRTE